MILGGGPNRIGQGIEFDYCCVHAAFALREDGFETMMVNSNPETVSTDYDTSDKLYFEPLTLEDVLQHLRTGEMLGRDRAVRRSNAAEPRAGLQKNGVNIIGTPPQSIEMRRRPQAVRRRCWTSWIPQPPNGSATNEAEACGDREANGLSGAGPAVFVLGGRAMQIVYSDSEELQHYMRFAVEASPGTAGAGGSNFWKTRPKWTSIASPTGRRSRHLSAAMHGTHRSMPACIRGDSAWCCRRTPFRNRCSRQSAKYTHAMARELKVIGLMNVQYAVKGETFTCWK